MLLCVLYLALIWDDIYQVCLVHSSKELFMLGKTSYTAVNAYAILSHSMDIRQSFIFL